MFLIIIILVCVQHLYHFVLWLTQIKDDKFDTNFKLISKIKKQTTIKKTTILSNVILIESAEQLKILILAAFYYYFKF